MKVTVQKNDFHASQVQQHGSYKVANSVFMQEMLSNKLYSDKIKAVIRELSTNAVDSHIKDGHNEPFKVHLPTSTQPKFSIRDFGTGLSLDDLVNLYTIYGVSDKRERDDLAGCFGLGSKSPYAYTGMWTAISYFNGKKYIIVNSKDSNGRFCYDILDESDTTESNGLEISFDVAALDVAKFQEKAKEIYKWFSVKPDCNYALEPKPIAKLKNNDWEIYSYYQGPRCVVMGNVNYPIESSHFHKSKKATAVLINCSVCIYLNLDSGVTIPPSREALEYTDNTINVITTKLEEIYDYIFKYAEDKIRQCKCLWDARVEAKKFFTNGELYFIGAIIGNNLKYQGIEVGQKRISEYNLKMQGFEVRYYSYGSEKRKSDIDIGESTKIAIIDSQAPFAAARRYSGNVYLLNETDSYKIGKFAKFLGIPKSRFLKTSSFPKLEKAAGQTVKRAKDVAQIIKYNNGSFQYNEDLDLNAERGYYVPIYRYQIDNGADGIEASKIKGLANKYKIVGVVRNRVARFEKHKNWKHIKEALKDFLDEQLKNPLIGKFFKTPYNSDFYYWKDLVDKIDKDSKFRPFIEDIDNYYKNHTEINGFNELVKVYEGMDEKFEENKQPYIIKYPEEFTILNHISRHDYNKPEVIKFINSIKQEKHDSSNRKRK